MRLFIFLSLLAIAPFIDGCASVKTCDGRTASDTCELHHTLMDTETVAREVMPPPSPEYLAARQRGFIHSYPYTLPEQCKFCVIFVCEDCVRAEQQWRRQHPVTK